MQLQTTGQRPDFGVALASLLDAQSQFKMLSYSSRFFPYAGETHRNVLKFLWESPASNSTSSSDGWYEIPHVPCPRLWFLCCLQPGWMRSKGWPSSQPCPCRSKLSWSQRMESSDLSHEGLVTKPRTHLPSTRAMEPSTNQCPSIPTPHGRGWSVNKNQTLWLNGHLSFCKAVGSAAMCQRVCHWTLHTWEVDSFLPPGKATLNALNTGSAQAPSGNNELVEAKVLMHRINTGPRCWHVTSCSPLALLCPTHGFHGFGQQGHCNLRG